MTHNLIGLAGQLLTPELAGKLAGLLGVDEARAGAMAAAAIPLLTVAMGNASRGGIANLAGAMGPGGAADPDMIGRLGALLSDQQSAQPLMAAGGGLLDAMFKDKTSLLSTALAAFGGSSGASATSLLKVAAPVVGALLARLLTEQGKDRTPETVLALLKEERSAALAALPPRLKSTAMGMQGLAALLGLGSRTGVRLIPWILLLLALGLLLWWLFGRDRVDVATCNAEFSRVLTGATINFDTGDATIAADSRAIIDEVAAVARRCKAYRFEISGHTDTVGDEAMNKALSERRAAAVVRRLAQDGIPADRMRAVGYGADRLKVPTGDEVAMEANRRIEILVSE
jgi:outer membrane protein OmpA-like peptidoglycan-associated protein